MMQQSCSQNSSPRPSSTIAAELADAEARARELREREQELEAALVECRAARRELVGTGWGSSGRIVQLQRQLEDARRREQDSIAPPEGEG